MLSNSLKSQVLKLLRLGPSKRKGIKWEAPKEDLARKALLSTGNNCQPLSKVEKPTAGTIRWLDPTLTVKQASVASSANLRTTLQATGKVAFRVITQPHLMPTKFQRQQEYVARAFNGTLNNDEARRGWWWPSSAPRADVCHATR